MSIDRPDAAPDAGSFIVKVKGDAATEAALDAREFGHDKLPNRIPSATPIKISDGASIVLSKRFSMPRSPEKSRGF
jgi:hypothetical protein